MEGPPVPPLNDSQSALRSPHSPPSSSLQLNLPSTMSRTSLALETLTPSRQIDRMINSNHSQSPSRTIYSDRFIPSRSGSNFALFDISPPANSQADGREDHSSAYAALLRTALFGPEAGVASPATPEKRSFALSPPSRNIFRYKTETRRSMHSLSPFGFDDSVPGVNHSPVKAPRKVPRSPYKVNLRLISTCCSKIFGFDCENFVLWYLILSIYGKFIVVWLGFGCTCIARRFLSESR